MSKLKFHNSIIMLYIMTSMWSKKDQCNSPNHGEITMKSPVVIELNTLNFYRFSITFAGRVINYSRSSSRTSRYYSSNIAPHVFCDKSNQEYIRLHLARLCQAFMFYEVCTKTCLTRSSMTRCLVEY